MTYLAYHLRYTLPPLAAVLIVSLLHGLDGQTASIILVLCGVVVIATFPWDNAAVRAVLWEFPKDRVWFRIKALPMEEVAFFVIQTLLVSLAMFVATGLLPNISGPQTIETRAPYLALACAILAAGTLVGIRVGVRSYGWHLLVWSVPLILAQWCIGWPLFIPRIQTLMLVTAVCSAYLIWTDVQAIKRGIWYFDHRKVGRRRFFGVLPWEEAMFFVLTSLLVAQSYVLLAPEHSR